MSLLSEILSSKIRADIFRLFFGVSDNELHMREIERRSGYAIGTIQSELRKLLRLDLVNKRKDGNRTYYRANKDHPLFLDIQRLVLKTVGLVDILQNKLTKSQEITIAFVFGSIVIGIFHYYFQHNKNGVVHWFETKFYNLVNYLPIFVFSEFSKLRPGFSLILGWKPYNMTKNMVYWRWSLWAR